MQQQVLDLRLRSPTPIHAHGCCFCLLNPPASLILIPYPIIPCLLHKSAIHQPQISACVQVTPYPLLPACVQVTPYPLLLFGGTITVQLAAGSVAIDGRIRLACAPKVCVHLMNYRGLVLICITTLSGCPSLPRGPLSARAPSPGQGRMP